MTTSQPRVLIVDDEHAIVTGLARMLARSAREFEVVTATSGEAALATLEASPCAVVVSDLRMPGMSGIELFSTMARRMPATGRVLLSGTADGESTIQAMRVAHRFLCKPSESKTIVETCRDLYHYGSSGVGAIVALGVDVDAMACAEAAIGKSSKAVHDAIAAQPALIAGLLHAVGSEYLGSRTSVTTIDDALEVIGPSGLARLLRSGLFQIVEGAAADGIVALAAEARTCASELAARGEPPIAVLAARLANVDRIGSLDANRWTGIRVGGNAATLLGLWGAPTELVQTVAAFATTAARRIAS